MKKKWAGSALFVAILLVLGLTVGLKLYRSGLSLPATTGSAQQDSESSPKTSAGSAPTPTTSTPTSSTSSPGAATPAPATPAPGPVTVNGNVEQTPYGPIEVSVTFAGKTITAVKELEAPNDRARSIQINRYAEPILKGEVLKSQSGHVDTVSGATYTSEGYARSVQSAIDRL